MEFPRIGKRMNDLIDLSTLLDSIDNIDAFPKSLRYFNEMFNEGKRIARKYGNLNYSKRSGFQRIIIMSIDDNEGAMAVNYARIFLDEHVGIMFVDKDDKLSKGITLIRYRMSGLSSLEIMDGDSKVVCSKNYEEIGADRDWF